jgi:hypothetical protein
MDYKTDKSGDPIGNWIEDLERQVKDFEEKELGYQNKILRLEDQARKVLAASKQLAIIIILTQLTQLITQLIILIL